MSTGNIKIFGLPDFCSLPSITITGGSEASADFPASNAKTEVPSDTWRSDGYAFFDTWLRADAEYEGGILEFSAGGFALINHNLWPWSGDVRFLAGEGITPHPTPEDLWGVSVPTAILASTNLTVSADIDDVNNGFTPDGAGFVPSSLAAPLYDFRLSMGSPGGTLAVGADLQAIYIRAFIPSAVAPTSIPPESVTMQVEIWENGSLVEILDRKAVCTANWQWFIYRWDAAILADVTGVDVEVKVSCTINSGPTPERRIAVDEVAWVYELDGAVAAGGGPGATILYDSGWLPVGQFIPNPTSEAITLRYLPLELTQGDCVAHDILDAAGASVSEIPGVSFVYVLIREDHSPDLDSYNVTTFPTSPPGYVEMGKLLSCASVFTTEINFSVGPLDGIRDLSTTKFTKGGNQYGSRDGILRTAQVDFLALTSAEKAFITDRILRRRGISRPILVSLTPTDLLEAEALTFYATISQQETTASTQLQEDYRRRLTLNLVEYR